MTLGEDVEQELRALVHTMDVLPGTFRPEFTLTYWAGVSAEGDAWCCSVEGDIHGDDGSAFTLLGRSAADVLRRARLEALRRVP